MDVHLARREQKTTQATAYFLFHYSFDKNMLASFRTLPNLLNVSSTGTRNCWYGRNIVHAHGRCFIQFFRDRSIQHFYFTIEQAHFPLFSCQHLRLHYGSRTDSSRSSTGCFFLTDHRENRGPVYLRWPSAPCSGLHVVFQLLDK